MERRSQGDRQPRCPLSDSIGEIPRITNELGIEFCPGRLDPPDVKIRKGGFTPHRRNGGPACLLASDWHKSKQHTDLDILCYLNPTTETRTSPSVLGAQIKSPNGLTAARLYAINGLHVVLLRID